jgi:Predicted metal-binding, possibly nucleic acid-binding protein
VEKEDYKISLAIAEKQSQEYDFEVDGSMFKENTSDDIIDAHVSVKALLVSIEGQKRIDFRFKGFMIVPCDRCLEPLEVKIEQKSVLYLRNLGQQISDQTEDEDVLSVASYERELDLSHYIYETILLCKPMQCVHKKGECSKEMIEKLKAENNAHDKEIDPRWEALRNIKLD